MTVRVRVILCVTVPQTVVAVPVMVTGKVPADVELLVEMLNAEEPGPAGFGLKLALAPVGKPVALKDTVPLKPLSGLTVMVLLALPPGLTVAEVGFATNVKSAGAVTTRLTVVVCVRPPLVPVMVSVYVPGGVVQLAVALSVDVPEPLTEAGLKLVVIPEGELLALSATVPLKPLSAPIATV